MTLLTPDQLIEEIIKEVPELRQSLSDKEHIKTTTLLREYVYNHIVWSNDGLQLHNYCDGNVSNLSVSQINFLFNTREIGVLCGGVATYLSKIYELFGYHSSIYNYGIPDISTHVTTVVTVPVNGVMEIVVHDATFNLSYVIQKTGDRSFINIMNLLIEGRNKDIEIKKGDVKEKIIYFSDNLEGIENIELHKKENMLFEEPIAGTTMLTNRPIFYARGDIDFHSSYVRRYESNILKAVSERLQKDINNCNVLDLMLFPLNLPYFKHEGLQVLINNLENDLLNCKFMKNQNDLKIAVV